MNVVVFKAEINQHATIGKGTKGKYSNVVVVYLQGFQAFYDSKSPRLYLC